MSKETFGDWCLYKETVFCQERESCVGCAIYYEDMPLSCNRRTLGQIEKQEHWDELEAAMRLEERR